MTIDIDDLEATLARATPGEWEAYSAVCCPDMGGVRASGYRVCADSVGRYGHPMTIEDAEAVAAMRRAVPLLIAEVRRLRSRSSPADGDGHQLHQRIVNDMLAAMAVNSVVEPDPDNDL